MESSLTELPESDRFLNRELSFLEFNRRVLLLAYDVRLPLLERLQFLCICSSNLDEFFEVRVAGLQQQEKGRISHSSPDGLTPGQQLDLIAIKAKHQVRHHYRLLNNQLLPALREEGVRFVSPEHGWTDEIAAWAVDYFNRELLPVLSPLGLDRAHPFPLLMNKSLNFVITLEGKDAFGREASLAVLRAPRSLPRLITVPGAADGVHQVVLLSTMIEQNVGLLFPGLTVTGTYQFRVTRNSDLFLEDEDIADLRQALQDELSTRNYGEAVRLEVDADCPPEIVEFLLEEFHLRQRDLYVCNGPVNLNRLQSLPGMVSRRDLQYPVFISHTPEGLGGENDLFARIRQEDVLLHYPYESSSPVVNLLRKAAQDPNVLAIKQTLYRTGTESVYVDTLLEAAANGKDVTVVIELRARFDEEANIELATRLQQEGVQVVYGVVGKKAHAKMTLIVRRESGRIVRYVNVSTGNYHTRTSRSYTDLSLLTANKDIAQDVQDIFNQVSGHGRVSELRQCLYSPFTFHTEVLRLIEEQATLAKSGKPSGIRARMNSLSEKKIINALYAASQAGVPIQLVVRGICTLKPGVPGVSENILVRSVLGRFLEHSRVLAFGPHGEEEVYISSADLMPRNMFHRVEIAVPLLSEQIRQRVIDETLQQYTDDNSHSWELMESGRYRRCGQGGEAQTSVQDNLLLKLNLSKQSRSQPDS